MRTISQLLLSVLLNACWQIVLISAFVALCSWLLRSTAARYRHALWVTAILLCFFLPILSAVHVRSAISDLWVAQPPAIDQVSIEPLGFRDVTVAITPKPVSDEGSISISQRFAAGLVFIYLLILILRTSRLILAWERTRAIIRSATPLAANEGVQTIVEHCRRVIGFKRFKILTSSSVSVPVTVGVRNPAIILPEKLLSKVDVDLLTSGIGHELIHVSRRDYLLNLLYELIYLPLSFHPAAALIRRRIHQTRELCCDERVTQCLQDAQVYARSLLQLAASAPPQRRLAVTTAVGIADTDNLEVRVMSLLRKPKLKVRQNKLLLIAAALLLVVPCIAAGSFALSLSISQQETAANEQQEDKRLKREQEEKESRAREERERGEKAEFEGKTYEWRPAREREEKEMRAKQQAELAKRARISMDQAIQIATSQSPGTVLECSLVGQRFDSPEAVAKGDVLYHVVIFPANDSTNAIIHVMVSATDGRIITINKEGRNEEEFRKRKLLAGGLLNQRALSLPKPEYPEEARDAGVEGPVAVQVIIDEEGNVIEAGAVSGPDMLREAAEKAARLAKFTPVRLSGEPVKFKGTITYNFVKE